jgi:hypothetical protein
MPKKTDTFFKGVCCKAWAGANRLLPRKKGTKMNYLYSATTT